MQLRYINNCYHQEKEKKAMKRKGNDDEPANGWSGEMIRDALSRGESLIVDQNGDVWTYNGHVCDYVGKVRCL